MLRVPQLDDMTYEQIMRRVISKIPTMTDKWTDFNYHDPGVTVLQTYAWLVDMLQYYMNATGDAHMLKYLKLLGAEPAKAQKAEAILKLEGKQDSNAQKLSFLAGTRFYAGEVCFELPQCYEGEINAFCSYLRELEGTITECIGFVGKGGASAPLFSQKGKSAAWFGFEKALPEEAEIYFGIREDARRNAFGEDFSLCELGWQYYDGENWTDVTPVSDKTGGLLKSGSIVFSFQESMKPCKAPGMEQEAYYLRCHIVSGEYDQLPELVEVLVDPMRVTQQETLCFMEEYRCGEEGDIPIHRMLQEEDYLLIGVEESKGTFSVGYSYREEAQDRVRIRRKDDQRFLEILPGENRPAIGSRLLLMGIRESILSEIQVGVTDGCSNQKVPFFYPQAEEVAGMSLTLWQERSDHTMEFQVWHQVTDLWECDCEEKAFVWLPKEQCMMFGDGIHGRVPDQGLQIYVTELVLSRFANGNVRKGELNASSEADRLDVQLSNPFHVENGRNEETLQELLERIERQLLKQNRMVCPEDYRELVKATPGLLIDEVCVVPGRVYGALHEIYGVENEVFLAVKPVSETPARRLSGFYQEQIRKHIDPYCLINTKVNLVSPDYVGLEIKGKVSLQHGGRRQEEELKAYLMQLLFPHPEQVEFGKVISAGRIFTGLEIHENVKKVEELYFERTGRGAERNERGDILLHADAVCYVRSIEIEFS